LKLDELSKPANLNLFELKRYLTYFECAIRFGKIPYEKVQKLSKIHSLHVPQNLTIDKNLNFQCNFSKVAQQLKQQFNASKI
jgi:hypothetical protein